jgi:hypothetical protein
VEDGPTSVVFACSAAAPALESLDALLTGSARTPTITIGAMSIATATGKAGIRVFILAPFC